MDTQMDISLNLSISTGGPEGAAAGAANTGKGRRFLLRLLRCHGSQGAGDCRQVLHLEVV